MEDALLTRIRGDKELAEASQVFVVEFMCDLLRALTNSLKFCLLNLCQHNNNNNNVLFYVLVSLLQSKDPTHTHTVNRLA